MRAWFMMLMPTRSSDAALDSGTQRGSTSGRNRSPSLNSTPSMDRFSLVSRARTMPFSSFPRDMGISLTFRT